MTRKKFMELWAAVFERNEQVSDDDFNFILAFLQLFQVINPDDVPLELTSQKDILLELMRTRMDKLFLIYYGGEG